VIHVDSIRHIAKLIRPSNGVRANVMYRDPEPIRIAADFIDQEVARRDLALKTPWSGQPLEVLYEAVNQLQDPYDPESKDGQLNYKIAESLMTIESALKQLEDLISMNETYTDDRGTVWTRPTAEAYARACRTIENLRKEHSDEH